jgi:feruloyl esterase
VNGAVLLAALGWFAFSGSQAWAASCDSLKSLKLPDTTITVAEEVPAGGFHLPEVPVALQPPGNAAQRNAVFPKLPAFCRVGGDIHPAPNSDIKFEVWMPIEKWNGRFEAVGNGGYAGNLEYAAMGNALLDGYTTGSTDTGHAEVPGGPGAPAPWALNTEAIIDFGYRAVHEMTVKSKATIVAFYGSGPQYSYWNGCSEGGRQGMGEAERYPNDFNGILAGAPVFSFVPSRSREFVTAKLTASGEMAPVPQAKYKAIYAAILEQCDAADGVKDGVINDPQQCHFDPAVLLCKNGDATDCLTAPQVKAMQIEYGGVYNPVTHALLARGHSPGFEVNLANQAGRGGQGGPGGPAGPSAQAGPGGRGGPGGSTGQAGQPNNAGAQAAQFSRSFYRYFVYQDLNWDASTFDYAKDFPYAEKKVGGILDNYDPNLKAFKAAGGKLISYHGWADNAPAPMTTVDYFNEVQKSVGDSSDFYRLFMVPGMGHCQGGPGTDHFDKMAAITDWVERGKAPESIVASHITDGQVSRTRPLCPYPQVAKYKGTGSTDDAANFACMKP